MDKRGQRDKALQVFEWMDSKQLFDTQDPFLYARLMTMFTHRPSNNTQALRIFDWMQSRGIKPDVVTYNTAINAAGEHHEIHAPMLQYRL